MKTQGPDDSRPDGTVSFIVPAFNEERYLPACLASIRAQRGEFEIIVVDNNSTDGTAAIALQWTEKVTFCRTPGIAAARNCGASSATTEFLAFVDADAQICGKWLEQGLMMMIDGGFDAVCGWNYFTEGNPLRFLLYNTYSIGFLTFAAASAVLGRPVVAGNNLLIRKNTLEAAGGFPCFVGEDLKLSHILNQMGGRIGFCPAMRIAYASRRFRQQGFFRVMGLWLSTLGRDLAEGDYAIDYQRKEQKTRAGRQTPA